MNGAMNYVGLFACLLPLGVMAQVQEKTISVEVCNEWSEAKEDEPVVIRLNELHLPFRVHSAVVTGKEGEIPSQLDDMNGDRYADELAFVTDLKPKGERTFTVTFSSERTDKSYPARTHAQMYAYDKTGVHDCVTSVTTPGNSNIYSALYHHGPAFESELVGYRVYFNDWQTVDTYGKRHKRLELEHTRFYTNEAQLAQGYGDDVLRVGQTVSVGTLKGWDASASAVTPISPVGYRTEAVVASGPVRSIVEVLDENWLYHGEELTMKTQYILYAGHRDVEVNVSFASPLKSQTFCTGVLRKEGDRCYFDEKGMVAGWSIDWPQDDTVKYARDTVGLAVCLPEDLVVKKTQNPKNYLYLIQAPNSSSFTYYFSFTSKRETFGFADAEEWFEYTRRWKESLQHLCRVVIKEN